MLGAGIIASIPSFWTLPPKLLAGAGAGAAGGIAVINTLGQFGGIVSPVMVGRIKDLTGSTTPALYVIGVCALIAVALLMWGLPQKLRTLDKFSRHLIDRVQLYNCASVYVCRRHAAAIRR